MKYLFLLVLSAVSFSCATPIFKMKNCKAVGFDHKDVLYDCYAYDPKNVKAK